MKLKNDYLDYYRMEYNDVIMSKATGGNGIIQEKYVTVSVCKRILRMPEPTLPVWAQS